MPICISGGVIKLLHDHTQMPSPPQKYLKKIFVLGKYAKWHQNLNFQSMKRILSMHPSKKDSCQKGLVRHGVFFQSALPKWKLH